MQFRDDTVPFGHEDRLAARGRPDVFAEVVLEDLEADAAHVAKVATGAMSSDPASGCAGSDMAEKARPVFDRARLDVA